MAAHLRNCADNPRRVWIPRRGGGGAQRASAGGFTQRKSRGAVPQAACLRPARHGHGVGFHSSRTRSATRPTGSRSSCRPRRPCSGRPSTVSQRAGLPPTARMALEKPLGNDLESSREINDAVAAAFPEDRIFRIDHYLGKETVQNLLALRFANPLFEPIWNCAHIDHVQITVSETVGLEGAAIIMTMPARSATWCRTTCCNCSRWSPWSRPPSSTRPRSATRRSRCCARSGRSTPARRRRDA